MVFLLTRGAVMADPVEERFRAAFEQVSDTGVVAMAAGYVRGDKMPVIVVRGPRFKGSEQLLKTDARWHIGSITKSFTATVLMRMAERGEIDFDSSLSNLLPEYAADMHPSWHDLTLTEVLSHTAGLRPNFTLSQMIRSTDADNTAVRLNLLGTHWGKPLSGKRGQHVYSNIGYVLAGFIAETRAGASWQDLIRREIARPLGLTSLGFGPPRGAADPWGHKRRFFVTRPVNPSGAGADNPAWLGPAGTLHMSLADLLRWGQTHMRACRGEMPEFLSALACVRLHTPVADDYALGWAVQTLEGLNAGPIQSHNGSNTMWVAELAYSAERDTVLAVAMNTGDITKAESSMRLLVAALMGVERITTPLLVPKPSKP